jgi:hypothetical protein
MKTIEDYEEGEILARHYRTIPQHRKAEITYQILQLATQRGGTDLEDCTYWLDSPEFELLVYLLGREFPICDRELADAWLEFLLLNPL